MLVERNISMICTLKHTFEKEQNAYLSIKNTLIIRSILWNKQFIAKAV
jgi:hypothetical protein